MRVLIKKKTFQSGEIIPSLIADGPYLVTWDTAARRLVDIALDVPVRINLDGAAMIEDVTMTVFTKSLETDFLSDFYEYRHVEIFDSSGYLLFYGNITESTYDESKGTVKLVCRSNFSRYMTAPFTYSNLSQNPVEAVKSMIEAVGGAVDQDSYPRVYDLLEADTVRAAFSFNLADQIGTFDAVERTCGLFGFYIFQEAGVFYFWAPDTYRNDIPLSENDIGNIKYEFQAAKYTQLSVTWELGTNVEVLTKNSELYGLIDHAVDLSRPANIVAFEVGTITHGVKRMFDFRSARRRFIEFISEKNLDLRERYTLQRETASIQFQIVEKTLTPAGIYSYRALLTGASW